MKRFFSIFYFSINAGSFLSTVLTPILRSKIHKINEEMKLELFSNLVCIGYINCFDTDQCFALAFGVPAVLMIIAVRKLHVTFCACSAKHNHWNIDNADAALSVHRYSAIYSRYKILCYQKPNKEASVLYLKVLASIAVSY